MATCEVCGNDYDKAFEVVLAAEHHIFESFECAIQELAPPWRHCGCRVIGRGTEVNGAVYCCAHCARQAVGTREAGIATGRRPEAQGG